MQSRHTFISGGLGFIGSALVEGMSAAGTDVTVVDSLTQSVLAPDHFARAGRRNIKVFASSVGRYLREGASLEGHDLAIHAASLVGPVGILKHAGSIGSDIVDATAALIEECLEWRIPLIYFSSAEVYGRSGTLKEEDDIRIPACRSARIEYALAKLTCEQMVLNSARRGLRSIIIRPFNVAGPRQSRAGGFVLPTFVRQAVNGEPLTVFDSGEQVRAFLGLKDLVRFILETLQPRMLERPMIVNLGNPANASSINELARQVLAVTRSPSKVVHTDGKTVHGEGYEEAASRIKLPDVARALELGWSPSQPLHDIIEEVVAFFRANGDLRDVRIRSA